MSFNYDNLICECGVDGSIDDYIIVLQDSNTTDYEKLRLYEEYKKTLILHSIFRCLLEK